MSSLGQFARRRGDQAQAEHWAEKNLALMRGTFQLFDAGQIALDRGSMTQAHALFREGLSRAQNESDESATAYFLYGFALIALQKEQLWHAAQLLGAAERLRAGEVDILGQRDYVETVERIELQMGKQAFTAAWAEGRNMTPEQVLAAPKLSPESASKPAPPGREVVLAPKYPAGLSAREVDVLRLVAQGLTDAQVAESLVISPRTVNWHLTSIYSKLGVSSRAAATRYAVEQHLL